jgi:hypothetical protein
MDDAETYVYFIREICYYEAHWLFSWRYITISEMLAKATGGKMLCSQPCIKTTNILGSIFIFLTIVFTCVYR